MTLAAVWSSTECPGVGDTECAVRTRSRRILTSRRSVLELGSPHESRKTATSESATGAAELASTSRPIAKAESTKQEKREAEASKRRREKRPNMTGTSRSRSSSKRSIATSRGIHETRPARASQLEGILQEAPEGKTRTVAMLITSSPSLPSWSRLT